MTIAELISILSEQLGVSSIEPGSDGEYTLFFDGMKVDLFEDRDEWIWLRGEAATIPADDSERFLRQALQWNFGRVQRQEASLSMDPNGQRLWLHQRLPKAHLTAQEATQAVEQFVNGLEFWRRRLAESAREETPRGPLPFLMR
jgi:hypothetical protein